MRQVPLVTCILLRYTKINSKFCLPAKRPHCRVTYTACETPSSGFEVRNNIALNLIVTVSIASFKTIGIHQREGLRQSCAVAFSWNRRMHG